MVSFGRCTEDGDNEMVRTVHVHQSEKIKLFPEGLVEISPINNFKCLFEIDVVQLLWYVYDKYNSQGT